MNRPTIGFIGLSDNWESEPLSSHAERIKDKNNAMTVTEVFTNSAEYGVINQDEFFKHSIAKRDKIGGYYIVRPNDFVYNPRISVTAPVGPINRNRLDYSGVMSPLYTVFRTHDILPEFLEMFFKTFHWHKYMRVNGNSGARHDRFSISTTEFFKMPIPVPNSDEQHKVATFLNNLDIYIRRTSEELDKLKNLKQASLQTMFPQDGDTVPRVRFKGFTKEWEHRKLGDYLTIRDDVAGSNFTRNDVLSVSGEFGVVNQIAFQGRSFAGASIANYRVVNSGNVVYTKSPLKANPYGIIKTATDEEGIVSPLYAVYNPNDNCYPDFVNAYFDSNFRLNLYLRTLVNKGAKNTLLISDQTVLEGMVFFPEIDEQKAIADYFKQLDKYISLKREELEHLKHIKAACLEKMFVKP